MIDSLLFLNLNSKPQQLSTYALTLFNYKTEVNGQKVLVGKWHLFHTFNVFCTLNKDLFGHISIVKTEKSSNFYSNVHFFFLSKYMIFKISEEVEFESLESP